MTVIKECKVLSYNQFRKVIVFDYDGKLIQANAEIENDCKIVFVENVGNKYRIVSEEYMKEQNRANKRKKVTKQETEMVITDAEATNNVETDNMN